MPDETTVSRIDHDDDNEFGDFSSVDKDMETKNGSNENGFKDGNAVVPTSDAENNAFGDFGSSSNQRQDEGFTDDFGSFEAFGGEAAETSAPEIQPIVTDHFGSFADAVTGGNAKMEGKSQQTSDFGSLESSRPQNGARNVTAGDDFGIFEESEKPVEPEKTEDFGDFTEKSTELTKIESEDSLKKEKVDEVDNFGDFGGFDSAEQTSDSDKIDQKNNGVAKDDFGSFDKADKETDSFGDFDVANDMNKDANINSENEKYNHDQPEKAGAPEATAANNDDFGDFGDFDGPIIQKEDAAAVTDSAGDDDFGDFGEGRAESQDIAQQGVTTSDSDDFGDFGGSSTPKQDAARAGGDSATESQDVVNKETTADDEDFGDFGDFGGSTTPAQDAVADNASAGDDFGDFGENDAEKQGDVNKEVTDAGDEEFGDFGDFGGESAPKQDVAAVDTSAGGDDFGDFEKGGAVEQDVVQQGVTAAEDDDFGDFDGPTDPKQDGAAADASAGNDDFGDFDKGGTTEQDVPKKGIAAEDDDFGDFGDFGGSNEPKQDAATAADSAGDDDFGDFDESGAQNKDHVVDTPQQVDPTLLKARGVFTRIFDGIEPLVEGGDDDSAQEVTTIKSLLSSIDVRKADSGRSPTDSLLMLLEENGDSKKSPNFIVAGEGNGLNAHFAVHVRGSFFSGKELENDLLKTRKSDKKYLPEVLPIELTKLKPTRSNTGSAVTGSLSTADTAEVTSVKVLELLNEIPDLSYMLEKKLSLPVR